MTDVKRISLYLFYFFAGIIACTQHRDTTKKELTIIWNDGRAKSLAIPIYALEDFKSDSIENRITVRLLNERSAIAGGWESSDKQIIFTPVIPFTRGLSYEVFDGEKKIGGISIPLSSEKPELLAIYPSFDTVPENLLKIYISFSKPMVEGHALEYVTLRDEKGDSLRNIFLDLHPELWTEDGKTLTLWFDPGRIKRDLKPNKALGPPLLNGRAYTLTVAAVWPDQQGSTLSKSFSKKMIAGKRDSTSPNPAAWLLNIPSAGSTHPLGIDFGEALDAMLAKACIHIVDQDDKIVEGTVSVSDNQMSCFFLPRLPWTEGTYKLQVEGRLEDLAGNNLKRVFDKDLDAKDSTILTGAYFERIFRIRPAALTINR